MNDLSDRHGTDRRAQAPEVSVVVPTRDRPDLCWDAVRSALCQRGVRVEVIVVDDGSRAPGILQRKIACDPRVRLHRTEVSTGVAGARNRGIAAALAPWTALLDDDDLWAPDKLECQLRLAQERQLSLVYTDYALVDEDRRVRNVLQSPMSRDLGDVVRRRNPFHAGTSSVLVRTALLRDVGGFDERLKQLADWDLWLRLVGLADCGRCPRVLVARMEHTQNMQATTTQDLYREFAYLVHKHALSGAEASDGADIGHFDAWIAGWHRRSGRRPQAALAYLRIARSQRSLAALGLAAGVLVGERAIAIARNTVRRGEVTRTVGPLWWEIPGCS